MATVEANCTKQFFHYLHFMIYQYFWSSVFVPRAAHFMPCCTFVNNKMPWFLPFFIVLITGQAGNWETGSIFSFFPSSPKTPSPVLQDFLKILHKGWARPFPSCFSIQGWNSSGPEDLNWFRINRFCLCPCSYLSQVSMLLLHPALYIFPEGHILLLLKKTEPK